MSIYLLCKNEKICDRDYGLVSPSPQVVRNTPPRGLTQNYRTAGRDSENNASISLVSRQLIIWHVVLASHHTRDRAAHGILGATAKLIRHRAVTDYKFSITDYK